MRYKHLIGVVDLYRECVSKLNSGGYSLRGGQKQHIYSFENVSLINRNCQRRS
jgi:hypothetical protein